VLVRLLASEGSGHLARQLVTDTLVVLQRPDLIDDATLVVSELIANGVLHARTELSLSVDAAGDGIRVSVADGSSVVPQWMPSGLGATSGRGLMLVDRLSSAWGVTSVAGGGKVVWAQIDHATAAIDDATADELLELWGTDAWSTDVWSGLDVDVVIKVEVDIDVQTMLASRAHTEDLVRELQLMLLDAGARGPARSTPPAVIWLARRLDAATEEFHDARRQIYSQTLGAAKRGEGRTTLHLLLSRSDAGAARRWLDALDEADTLTADGTLLLPPFPAELTVFRHAYIHTLIDRLEQAAKAAEAESGAPVSQGTRR
jgi:anti-sigma regulatory factor (Ser/Thr protein kinase)